ncbi:MAG TPA: 4Fe-4S dicluster domain-containing protein, partial [Lachnospiraceae bacterium]|nr:4Fe-4S dicluster domain-containing protein [Lachnospiraceae bacterium]
PVYLLGGPMMGRIGRAQDVVTKTTNAVLVLPQEHQIVQRMRSSSSIDMKRAASACCQCQMCTDLCPRHLLGHPIEPHRFMRSAANRDFQDLQPFLDTMFCSSCGLCELFSCPQGLSPRTLIAEYKAGLRKAGVKLPDVTAAPVLEARAYRKAPEARLEARIGLYKYHKPAPISHTQAEASKVKLLLSQHIGAPAVPVVAKGETVTAGQMIAGPADGLSTAIHASIDGMVTAVEKNYIMIENRKGRADR